MRLFLIITFLLSLPLSAAAIEDFAFIETGASIVPNDAFFLRPTIPQRFFDEANDSLIVRLTEDDYRAAAETLGVETAAIKAVVDIETGRQHIGFCAPHIPIIDFDEKVFRRFCARKGKSMAKYTRRTDRGLSQQMREHQLLANACVVDSATAYECTMWGMFQIGGFNWKLCGAESLDDFISLMRYSERTQLELFTQYLINTGLVKYLQTKNWSAFAYRYNGPKYARRGYHTRLARSYTRFKSLE